MYLAAVESFHDNQAIRCWLFFWCLSSIRHGASPAVCLVGMWAKVPASRDTGDERRADSALVGFHGLPFSQENLGDKHFPLTAVTPVDGVRPWVTRGYKYKSCQDSKGWHLTRLGLNFAWMLRYVILLEPSSEFSIPIYSWVNLCFRSLCPKLISIPSQLSDTIKEPLWWPKSGGASYIQNECQWDKNRSFKKGSLMKEDWKQRKIERLGKLKE